MTSSVSAAARKSPLFYAFCPDYPNVLTKRLEVRPKHFERVEADKKAGIFEFGRGMLPPPSSPLHTHPSLPSGTQAMEGSIMFFRLPTLEDVWKRVKEDVYWSEGIWDKEKTVVGQFIKGPEEE
ncbi:hypothetical protein CI109_103313 [Kwoniella shandongensis]|uniref:Uncharacterized protein n=1 Tax=Kwoniella shandongensis TaxID=1734106 RepID=A0A5M6BRB3_9TREE|nr:uncharacterized protein CI109_007187 [Kwoniella shandongensis]KAA5524480.1 hypothetical protein CI109_007187 [Kwoniella shandongensis]